MTSSDCALPFAAQGDDEIELSIVDLRIAQAFWEGVPAARLLARTRLHRDERDLVDLGDRASGLELASSTWDRLMAQLLGGSAVAHDRVKRAIARHGRAASDEGPLAATDAAIAAIVHGLLSSAESQGDTSPAEGGGEREAVDRTVERACGRFDDRLSAPGGDRRAAAFEACLRLATLGNAEVSTSLSTLRSLGAAAISQTPLYPWGDDAVPVAHRRALVIDRAAAIASNKLAEALSALASHHGTLVAFVVEGPRSSLEAQVVPPSSWFPADFGTSLAASRLASALERGATTAPRARSVVSRGGDAALDAIGAEMLEVAGHPFASAVFADILGSASRERDVVRLLSYFAIAPDLASAAHALAASAAPELPTLLRAWLESLLPSARVAPLIASLEPYPHLHVAVASLLASPPSP